MTDEDTVREVEVYYDTAGDREWERLARHRMEHAITMRTFRDYLPPAPAAIADVGSGPGRYAVDLARSEYVVTVIDLSVAMLAQAEERAREAGVQFAGHIHTSVTDLSAFSDGSFDAVLLLGPLYHLIRQHDRERAVREAHRILRPGGVLFAAFITRYAPVRWAAKNAPDMLLTWHDRYEEMLARGFAGVRPGGGFTHAYFAHPSEIRPLCEAVGFKSLDLIACEGIISMIDEQVNELTGDAWEAWVDLNYRLGKDPAVFGAAEHLLYVGRKVAATVESEIGGQRAVQGKVH